MKRVPGFILSMAALLAPTSINPAFGQSQPPSEPQTREEALREEREEKAEVLTPPQTGALEKGLFWLEDGRAFERLLNPAEGFYPKLGSVTAGSGLGFGAGYRHLFSEQVAWNTFGSGTFRRYWALETRFLANNIANTPLFVDLHARKSDYPDEDYFGQGSTSLRVDHVCVQTRPDHGRGDDRLERDEVAFERSSRGLLQPERARRSGLAGSNNRPHFPTRDNSGVDRAARLLQHGGLCRSQHA